MKKIRRFMRSRGGTYLLFAAAAVLLIFSSVGGARAALIYSETYTSQVEMFDIGVELWENGQKVSERTYDREAADWNSDGSGGVLLEHMLDDEDGDGEAESLKPGKSYTEELQVYNSSSQINEYVRVTIYRYWMRQGADGTWYKDHDLSPKMIDLNLLTGSSGWHIDRSSTTDERWVLYYDKLLYCEQDADSASRSRLSEPLSNTITIDGQVVDLVKTDTQTDSDGKKVVTTTYAYDGARFVLEARVDAVQEHNADAAIWNSWGRTAEDRGGTIWMSGWED